MPFLKLGPDRYKGPTGQEFTAAQVRLYHANGGKFPGEKAAVNVPAGHVAQRANAIVKPKMPRLPLRGRVR